MRRPRLARQPVDHHRDGVAGIVDEQLLAGTMGLPHRHRQIGRPAPVKIAETAVAVAVRVAGDVFVPQDLQRHMLALQLPVHISPVRLGRPAMARLRAGRLVERGPQDRVTDLLAKRPGKSGG
jgi:hypothetical protein